VDAIIAMTQPSRYDTHNNVHTEAIMSIQISRVFMNGNSQAVRIPQEFRLSAKRVEISRNDAGDIVIHPLPEDRGQALLEALSGFDDEFVGILESERRDQAPVQERETL
jgi:antitoxin VapB